MAELIWSKLEKHFIVVESLAKESNEHDENVTLCCLIETENSMKTKNFGQNIYVS